MKIFTVYERLGHRPPDPEAVLVREGMAWWAIPFPVLWFFYHREWNWALAFLTAGIFIGLVTGRFFPDAGPEVGVIAFSLNLLAGFLGNDIRQWSLKGRGYVEGPVIVATDLYEAEQRYYKEHRNVQAVGTIL